MTGGIFYKVGEKVKINGLYVCVPCGHMKKYRVGDIFDECLDCMKQSKPISNEKFEEAKSQDVELDEFGEDEVAANLEIWELLKEE